MVKLKKQETARKEEQDKQLDINKNFGRIPSYVKKYNREREEEYYQ